jgi:hypothetical protein
MYRNNLFDNPIAIFLLFCISSFFNIVLPVHFISLFLLGVLFMAFSRCLDQGYNYSMLLLLVAFTIFELSHGLKIFSVSIVAFFIYIFVAPKIKASFASQTFYLLLVLLFLYISIGVLFYFLGGVDSKLMAILIMNYVLDVLIVSLIL